MGYVCPLGIAQLLKSWNQENTTSLISYPTLIFAWYFCLFVLFLSQETAKKRASQRYYG